MGKRKVGLYPADKSIQPQKEKVIIIEKQENAFLYLEKKYDCKGILPFARFISEEEISRVQMRSEVTIYKYFNASGKRLLAYHARYE